MTQNQSNQLVKNPNTQKAVAVLTKFATLESEYKALEKEAKEASELIKNAMIEAGIPKINIDVAGWTGYITLAERTNYKVGKGKLVDPMYFKSVLDADKVKAQAVLTGQLPEGVVESKTQYITKKIKKEVA